MADNFIYNEPVTGTTIAAKDISGVQYQKVINTDSNGHSVLEQASTATLTSVTATASSTMLIDSNANRSGLIVFNDGDKTLYLKYGTTASATSYTVQIASGGYWEMPSPTYTGRIDGIWAATPSSGAARITEV